jgi:hypothetical protein
MLIFRPFPLIFLRQEHPGADIIAVLRAGGASE